MSKKGNRNSPKSSPENLTRQVLKILNFESDKAFSFKALAVNLTVVTKPEKDMLNLILESLVEDGTISKTRSGSYQSNKGDIKDPIVSEKGKRDYVIGEVDFVNPRFAFILTKDGEGDIKISRDKSKRSL